MGGNGYKWVGSKDECGSNGDKGDDNVDKWGVISINGGGLM